MDSDCSHTSTPAYRRGKNREPANKVALHLLKEGLKFPIPKWLHCRGKVVHILADVKIKRWPHDKDNLCTVDYKPCWQMKDWVARVRAEVIRITSPTVIIYMERTMKFEDMPPLKNVLETLCKAVHQHQPSARIFVANMLPRIVSSPLQMPVVVDSNYTLLQAVHSRSRAVGGWVFYLSVYEHFTSEEKGRGKIISPIGKYFEDSDTLSTAA